MSKVWVFIVGFVLGALLLHSPMVDAAVNALMMGNYNGSAKVIQVTSTGAVVVVPQ